MSENPRGSGESGAPGVPGAPGALSDAFTADCPARDVLNHVGSRWGVLILAALGEGPMRFHVLRDRVGGISEKMLSQNLRALTRDGLTSRTVEPASPPRVTYALTPLGHELSSLFSGLVDWITLRVDDVLAAREAHDGGH